ILKYDDVILHDFYAWTAMIEKIEQKDNYMKLTKIRAVYDRFLSEFPLCHVYWKKYADHVYRLSDNKLVEMIEVYERASKLMTYSVDFWLIYCVSVMSLDTKPEGLRCDYLSYPLWDKYIEFESSQEEWGRLTTIYMNILKSPNEQLGRFFARFKELLPNLPRTAVQIYEKSEKFNSKIVGFETAIKRRPYFQVDPLDSSDLSNWHDYLNFIEQEGDFNKVCMKLTVCSGYRFSSCTERCIIACANYPEFWERYVLSMKDKGRMDLVNKALTRATQIHVERRTEIRMFTAKFHELSGHIEEARAAYQLLYSGSSPGRLEAIVRHAHMEYQLGNKGEAFLLYEGAIITEARKWQSQILPMLVVEYAHFCTV
ncbi:hypothetical protein MKW92_029808, partial [Papaver armeniacum]